MGHKTHQRHTMAAGVRDSLDRYLNDGSHPSVAWKERLQTGEVQVVRIDRNAFSVKADYFWWPGEGAEHKHDSAVFLEVGNGLDATARQIEIGHLVVSQNAESITPLWRAVDQALLGQWRSGDKENHLLCQPVAQLWAYRCEGLSHQPMMHEHNRSSHWIFSSPRNPDLAWHQVTETHFSRVATI